MEGQGERNLGGWARCLDGFGAARWEPTWGWCCDWIRWGLTVFTFILCPINLFAAHGLHGLDSGIAKFKTFYPPKTLGRHVL